MNEIYMLEIMKNQAETISLLQTENQELHNMIEKTIEVLDDLLIYHAFSNITYGYGNVKEELKLYLSEYKKISENNKCKEGGVNEC